MLSLSSKIGDDHRAGAQHGRADVVEAQFD
jgi:hypothetical protein